MTEQKTKRRDCPECGRQLHAVAEDGEYRGLYKCYNGPTFWRESEEGLVKEGRRDE